MDYNNVYQQTVAGGYRKQMENRRSNHIQILRGLAILAVVLIHTTPAGYCQVFVRPFLNFSVGMFLFLSGLLSSARNWNPGKRIRKVLVPYVIWTLLYVAFFNSWRLAEVPVAFLKSLIKADAAGMLYYIYVYCEFTLLIPVIDKLAGSRYRYLGFLITPLEVLFLRTIPLVTHWYGIPGQFAFLQDISCIGWFTYFYLGYLLGNGYLTVGGSTKTWTGLLAVSIPLQMLEGWWLLSRGILNCGTQMKLSAVFTGVCITVLAYRFIRNGAPCRSRLLELLGDNSFGIYFSHVAIIQLLKKVPLYTQLAVYPVNAVVVLVLNFALIFVGKKLLGKHSKYLAF